jgi:hypothetical protein
MFKEKMVTTAIPERVFALCKIVEKGPITVADIKEKLEPKFLENGTPYFNTYKNAAEELGLISISDDLLSLEVDPKVVKNIESMRRYINNNLERLNKSQFYQVTKAYYEMGSEILKSDMNIANSGSFFSEITGMPVDADSLRAWRFWASFLGFGYLQEKTRDYMFIIPNAYVFLEDIISSVGIEKKKKYAISEFIDLITPKANIVIDNNSKKELSYGVSNGLRALQDKKKIKLEHIHDQEDMWSLYPLKTYSKDSTITHISVL